MRNDRRTALTDTAIKAMQPPTKGSKILWDTLPGFGCRISQAGTRAFVVLVSSGRTHTIGRYPLLTLSDARREAKRLLAKKALGHIKPTHTAFEDALTAFLEDCASRNKPRTVADYTRLLTRHYPFGRTSIASITANDVVKSLNRLRQTPSERHHATIAGRIFFRWAVRQQLIERSPMESLTPPPPLRSRDRILSTDELAAVYSTALKGTTTLHNIIALCVLTGQRRSEIGNLLWEFVNEEARTISFPASYTKNKHPHIFPINDQAAAVLSKIPRIDDISYVFPASRSFDKRGPTTVWNGWGKGKANFDKECGVTNWVIHDLRRQVSSGMAALKPPVAQIAVEKLLNHISGGTQSPIAAVYNRHAYFGEMQDAVLRWGAFLDSLVAPKA